MKVAFRVDASIRIGTGHVMRCLTLADALRAHGAKCRFICRVHEGHLAGKIQERGYDVAPLPPSPRLAEQAHGRARHLAWLNATLEADLAQTLEALRSEPVDWLVVDHYALDSSWEQGVRRVCKHMLVIDDLADRSHDCDLLLDQNWHGTEAGHRYELLVPEYCVCLLGPGHALLQQEYQELRRTAHRRDGEVRRLLVFVGGSDQANLTCRILSALDSTELRLLPVDVVVGVNHPDFEAVRSMAEARSATTLHHGVPTLAPLMISADLMIGGGGTTNWERMCLGLPAIVVSIAQNQESINAALMKGGFITYLGPEQSVSSTDIRNCISSLLRQPELLREQSRRGQVLVDGGGAMSLATKMFAMTGGSRAAR